jgi:hypothetical protein
MSVWDEVKRGIDDISDVAKEVANLLAEKTDEISKEGKLKLEIFNLERQVRSKETKLGRKTYQLWSKDKKSAPSKDDDALGILSTMKDLHDKIQEKQKELESSREEKGEEEG